MKTQTEIYTKKGNTLRLIGLAALEEMGEQRLIELEKRLNRQQRKTLIGWLGKGRVQTLVEGLEKIEQRIEKDSMQGRRKDAHS